MSTPILKKLHLPDERLDMSSYDTADLPDSGLQVWQFFQDDTPYWWTSHDLPTIERYCYLRGLEIDAREMQVRAGKDGDLAGYDRMWKVTKSMSLEVAKVEYALGLTPQGRAALKLEHPGTGQSKDELDEEGIAIDPSEL